MPILDVSELIGFVYRGELDKLIAAKAANMPLNLRDSDKRTLLMHAVLAAPPQVEVARWLASNVKNLDSADGGQQWTALHFAARDHDLELVHIIVEAGATIDSLDVFGNTPLMRCLDGSATPEQIAVATYLVAHGADPRKQNKQRQSPMDVAQDKPGVLAAFQGRQQT